jgi:hypothetical protein
MTFVWKDKALRLAGKRGVAKARAYGLATNRRVPITLPRVRFLERPILPASERELTGKAPTRDSSEGSTRDRPAPKMQSPVRPRRARFLSRSRPRHPPLRQLQKSAARSGRQRFAQRPPEAAPTWATLTVASTARE